VNSGRRPLRIVASAALAVLLAACATDSKKASEEPAELTEFQGTAQVEVAWSATLGSSAPRLRLGLSLAVDGDVLFAANHAGIVFAFNKADGKRLWRTATKLSLTGGPGAGEGLVVAGSSQGDIVALDAATGATRWKSYINSELLAAPVIGKQTVVLRAVDGRIVALRASDGTRIWSAEQPVPRLSLRGTARPAIAGDFTLSGFDNGRVQALQLADGTPVWEVNVAPSGGRTELERLNDVDTQLQIRGNDVFVVAFQGKAARIDLETGQEQWSRDASSFSGLAVDEESAYITDADGAVVKLASRSGIETWSTSVLSRRRLSPPAVLGTLVAAADLEGYVHFLDSATGNLAARVRPLSARVTADPVVSGDTLFMLDTMGRLVALRATLVEAGAGTTTPTGSRAAEDSSTTLRPR
jgi:outer membrane protein assembly factor BamB